MFNFLFLMASVQKRWRCTLRNIGVQYGDHFANANHPASTQVDKHFFHPDSVICPCFT